MRAFLVNGTVAQLKSESDAPFRGAQLEGKGLYVAHLNFDAPGNWGAEITAQRPDGEHAVIRLPFTVVTNATVPAPGESAPLSHNPTAKDVSDISTIDSGQPPDDMHQLSVADAIAQHRPTLVAFATPAFCTSATCGPLIHALQAATEHGREWFRPALAGSIGIVAWLRGEFPKARTYFEQATGLADEYEQRIQALWFVPHDPVALAHEHLAWPRLRHRGPMQLDLLFAGKENV